MYLRRVLNVPSNTFFLKVTWSCLLNVQNVKVFLEVSRHSPKGSNGNGHDGHLLLLEMLQLNELGLLVVISCSSFSILLFTGIVLSMIQALFLIISTMTGISGVLQLKCLFAVIRCPEVSLPPPFSMILSVLYFHEFLSGGKLYFLQIFQGTIPPPPPLLQQQQQLLLLLLPLQLPLRIRIIFHSQIRLTDEVLQFKIYRHFFTGFMLF